MYKRTVLSCRTGLVAINYNPNISPIRLLASDRCLLSMSYGNLSSMLPLRTALDAPSLVFFALAGTCSLNQKNHYAFGHERPLTQKILSDHRINR